MKLLHIINAGVYRNEEKSLRYTTPQKCMELYLSGIVYSHAFFPDGTPHRTLDMNRPVEITLGMPGFYCDFEYGKGRTNYVIMYQCDDLIYQEDEHRIYIRENDVLLPLTEHVPLAADEVETMHATFQTIMEYHNSAIPQNMLSADLMLSALIPRFMQVQQKGDDPVERLRKSMDSDVKWEIPLIEHCIRTGCSRDHLCREFVKRYKISPGNYRIRKRLQQIVHCFAYTNLNVKEIAYSVGMKNVTHLNLLIRKYYNKTPSQMIREYRSPK